MAKKKHPSHPLPAGVPAGSLFVNETALTNDQVKEACKLTVSPTLRVFYFGCGILIGVAAVLARIFWHISGLTCALVLLVGLMTVWQGNRLPLDNARRMIAALDRAGEAARRRTTYATEKELGVILSDGTRRTFEWGEFSRAVATPRLICLTLAKGSLIFMLDTQGFTKGDAAGFIQFLAAHVSEPPRNAVARACDKICSTLDSWSTVQAAQKERDAAKKQARHARKAQRKEGSKKDAS